MAWRNLVPGRELDQLAGVERSLTGEQLSRREAERELIGARIRLLAAKLLGRHVRGRSDHGALHGDRVAAGGSSHAGSSRAAASPTGGATSSGIVRAGRAARRSRHAFVVILYSHVRSEERVSNASNAFHARIIALWSASSASEDAPVMR